MIEELNDIIIINRFLHKFNQSIVKLDDPFKKYLAYKQDNLFVGFLNYSLIYDRIEIEYIYVNSSYRNKGIASNLINYLVAIGYKNNCTNITLEVRKSNTEAIYLYKKNNFIDVAVRKNYYNNEDGILMLRKLG